MGPEPEEADMGATPPAEADEPGTAKPPPGWEAGPPPCCPPNPLPCGAENPPL
mgnify:CR=1 FL=1